MPNLTVNFNFINFVNSVNCKKKMNEKLKIPTLKRFVEHPGFHFDYLN